MNKKNLVTIIKYACATALLVCFVLPMSKCTTSIDSEGKPLSVLPAQSTMVAVQKVTYTYPLSGFDIRKPSSWLYPLALIWPLPLIVYRRVGTRKLFLTTVDVLEPILCGLSFYYVYALSGLGQRLVGGYLALTAYAVYFTAWITEFGTWASRWHSRRRT